MRVLVACEFSGIVRDAFIALGHDAWSCDLLDTETPGPHLIGDVTQYLYDGIEDNEPKWDLMIAHPPCTDLAVSGARWLTDHWVKRKNKPARWHDGTAKRKAQKVALEFVLALSDAPIERIAIENPISMLSSLWRKPDQIIQPWQFGHGETKATCLWLKGLPLLQPTKVVSGREAKVHKMAPSPDRWKDRSRTYVGIAQAMAEQWGKLG